MVAKPCTNVIIGVSGQRHPRGCMARPQPQFGYRQRVGRGRLPHGSVQRMHAVSLCHTATPPSSSPTVPRFPLTTRISSQTVSHLPCAELKSPADDRFDVFGDADRCSRTGDGRRRQSATQDARFARNALVRIGYGLAIAKATTRRRGFPSAGRTQCPRRSRPISALATPWQTQRPLATCLAQIRNGHGWFRTTDLSRVKRALSR